MDVYAGSGPALRLRRELGLNLPAILFAGGAMPKAADAMLFPWRRLLRSNDTLLFTCAADQAIWHLLVDRSELGEVVVPLAVDDTVFYPRSTEERVSSRLRYNLSPDVPLVVYVGRLNIQKNLHSLLKLLAAVRQDVPYAHLWLVGEEDDIGLWEFGAPNTNYVACLQARAREMGQAGAITFLGPLFGEDLARAYAAADVLVNLSFSHRENFGLSQAEAQACGVPVVCSAWGGFKDVVRDGVTGYVVDAVLTKNGIRVDWATGARYVTLLLRDRDRRQAMGQRAAAHAGEAFGIPALTRASSPVVNEATQTTQDDGVFKLGASAYLPSRFARRFERHKRSTDWSVPTPGLRAQNVPTSNGMERVRWYPRMFQGSDYDLYETIMRPYATRLALDLKPSDIGSKWVPYFASDVELDSVRQLARDFDQVWPHQTYFLKTEWAVLVQIDGCSSIRRIAAVAGASDSSLTLTDVIQILWCLHAEGFVLFRSDQ